MPLTRDFKTTIKARADVDADFRRALLVEGIQALLTGETDVGKAVLRDYINATVGFDALAKVTQKSPKSLMRMFSEDGNPRTTNLMQVIAHLQQREGVNLTVQAN